MFGRETSYRCFRLREVSWEMRGRSWVRGTAFRLVGVRLYRVGDLSQALWARLDIQKIVGWRGRRGRRVESDVCVLLQNQ
jgi:hypothetical protein